MKSWEYYLGISVKYPKLKDYCICECGNQIEITANFCPKCGAKFDYESANNEYLKAHKEYNKTKRDLRDEFKNDLFEELGITDNPKRERLFEVAWDRGHSDGFAEVYYCAEEIVDLIIDN